MNNRVVIFFVSTFLSVLGLSIVVLSGENRQETNNRNTQGLPEMTPRQREHSKLYRRGNRDLRKLSKSVQVVVTTPFIYADDEKTSSTIEDLLNQSICRADVVIIGTVENKTSQFTEDGSFVFTDYDLRVNEVLKKKDSSAVKANETITVNRPGGSISFDGKTVTVIDRSFEPFVVGRSYLLFLQEIPTTGAYRAVDRESSFELAKDQLRRLTATVQPFEFPQNANAILSYVRSSAAPCNSKGGGR